jgi:hypothetical protein
MIVLRRVVGMGVGMGRESRFGVSRSGGGGRRGHRLVVRLLDLLLPVLLLLLLHLHSVEHQLIVHVPTLPSPWPALP